MKTSLKPLVVLTLIVPCLSLFGVDAYKGHSKVGMGMMKKSSLISTRLSYGSGCIVGNCDYGYGYYIFSDGEIAIGKWGGTWLNGVGVDSRANYFAAGKWRVAGSLSFGAAIWNDGWSAIGNFAYASDGYWYLNGLGLEIDNGVTHYGTFSDGDLVQDGCTMYYSSKLRQNVRRILPTDDGVSTSSGSCDGICTNGIGKKTYSDGSYYIGDFANGMANGFGVYVQNNGSINAGRYVDHYLVEGYYTDSIGEMAFTMNYDIDGYGEVWISDDNGNYLGEYCSLQSGNTNTTPTVPANTSGIKQMVANKSFDVNGLFFQYGTGAFDWIYVEKSGSYAAKLAGANSDGFFDWDFIHTSDNPGFDYINVSSDGKSVKFGPLKGNVNLPGQ